MNDPNAALSGESAGAQIGRYKLLEQIGEGGMGAIWLAEQREPVRRRVALKIIKLGMDTKEVMARFEAERQALALMDHPHIAKVFDAGATEAGRPYFVMEYIKGVPILAHCDAVRLDTRERLRLFMSVCHAIQHAHQKGIIHRDIKPSNVLVTTLDGAPIPKVIDFGIAKAIHGELTTRTLFTAHDQAIGTPAYMSPEQAGMSGLDIDTRSDIYSLGILLYELLTGSTPFDMTRLAEKGFAEILRTIREEEPKKPSTRISTMGDQSTQTAAQRRADPKTLRSLLRGDIDWIVMKCLEKDRTRRYETANGLAADILRHLNDEPVTAGAPSPAYRFKKFVRRNRGRVVAALVILFALVLGAVGATSGLLRAIGAKDRADREAQNATLAAASETVAKRVAEVNARKALDAAADAQSAANLEMKARSRAETINDFVTTALNSSDANTIGGSRDTTILAAMEAAIREIDGGRFKDEPETEAELKTTIGRILWNNGRLSNAEPLFVQALAIERRLASGDSQNVATSLAELARLLNDQGRATEAEPLLVEALAIYRRLYQDDDVKVLAVKADLATVLQAKGDDSDAASRRTKPGSLPPASQPTGTGQQR